MRNFEDKKIEEQWDKKIKKIIIFKFVRSDNKYLFRNTILNTLNGIQNDNYENF